MARRRRRGDGTVFYDHAERVWVARVSLGVVNGKRVRRKVRATSEAGARRELELLQRSYSQGVDPARGTLDAYLSEWLPAHSRSIRASTAASYETHIRLHISPLLGGIPLARLTVKDVRRLVADLERKGKSAGYIHLIMRTLSVALQQAVNDRTIPDNAARGVKLPKIERDPVQAMTETGADDILAAVKQTWVEYPVRVMLGSGLRRGEVIGLDQRDLFLDAGFIVVRKSKTKIRAVPITEDAVGALRLALADAPRRGPDEPVFFGPKTGDRMVASSLSHALPKILEDRKVARLTPHGLRHGVATMMLTGGADIRIVQEQLGHSRIGQTAMYAHVVPTAQRSALRSIERRQAR